MFSAAGTFQKTCEIVRNVSGPAAVRFVAGFMSRVQGGLSDGVGGQQGGSGPPEKSHQ